MRNGYVDPNLPTVDQALDIIARLQQQQLIQLVDAAVVTWPQDRKAAKAKHAVNTTAAGALSGTFWDMLFGLIFSIRSWARSRVL